MECISTTSKKHCTCTYASCSKHGNCCKCVVFHRERNEIPGCFFSTEGERTYDRSLAAFLADRSR